MKERVLPYVLKFLVCGFDSVEIRTSQCDQGIHRPWQAVPIARENRRKHHHYRRDHRTSDLCELQFGERGDALVISRTVAEFWRRKFAVESEIRRRPPKRIRAATDCYRER